MTTTKETITVEALKLSSDHWIADAELLMREGRFETAYYLCGYAIEMALKRRICLTLGWKDGYPNKKKSFENLQSFKTHDLDMLLHLSGVEEKIRTPGYSKIWRLVADWSPEIRYFRQNIDNQKTIEMLDATRVLLDVL